MGDGADIKITPETPGRPAILNPFESPTDYHRLHESLVPSPSVFKSSRGSSTTPAKFKWSIDELASLHPVHIDPEDIHRQALFMSQTRSDAEIEQKRQNAIERFFTQDAIIPSPWGPLVTKQSTLLSQEKRSSPPVVTQENPPVKKTHATCQTTLSLPVDFNIEKVLGDYYRTDDVSEQVQECLSSSSLRRKLFLDGQASGSDSSSPSSPEREAHGRSREMSLVIISPMNCGTSATTPSSGQFSSSPIKERGRAYSLGSNMTSPLFPERSFPLFKSPTVSPIMPEPHASVTPRSGERKRLSFLSPDSFPSCSQNMAVNRGAESPYVEGCSPIHSSSPVNQHHSSRSSSGLYTHNQDKTDLLHRESLPTMELDACSPGVQAGHGKSQVSLHDSERMEQSKVTEDEMRHVSPPLFIKKAEEEEEVASGEEFCRLSSSRTGSVANAESTRMFVSLLAEGSMAPYDVSMQVDSGYNTYSTCTISLMDGVSSDSQSKEVQEMHSRGCTNSLETH